MQQWVTKQGILIVHTRECTMQTTGDEARRLIVQKRELQCKNGNEGRLHKEL
ncbi:hypothetical protein KSS87_015165 [Heliosperma pusillum]|nr:hypothetical protein KSS87_015165 [Heliosperma pusillum]